MFQVTVFGMLNPKRITCMLTRVVTIGKLQEGSENFA